MGIRPATDKESGQVEIDNNKSLANRYSFADK